MATNVRERPDAGALTVGPITGTIGAEVAGVDLADDLGDATITELSELLVRHKVLFFRDQEMDRQQQIALGRRFGPLEIHELFADDEKAVGPFQTVSSSPEILVVESKPEAPVSLSYWHSDVTFRPNPSLGSILKCEVAPPVGGDTLWADMEAAYEGLDDATQRHLSSLTAIHDWGFPRQAMLSAGTPQTRIDELVAKFPPVEHPVIRTHPVSRRKLVYVNPIYTVGIKGMSESEGRALLERLFRLPYTAEYQVRFRWTRNAVAFWDNRSTQHYVVNDFARYHRRMSRVTVAGDRPF